MTDSLARRLGRTEAFEALPEAVLPALAAALVEQRLPKGGLLFKDGAPANHDIGLYVVLEGTVAVRVPRLGGGYIEARQVDAGELVGLLGLISPSARRHANVIALTDTVVAHMPRGAFLALYEGHDRLSVAFLRVVGNQLARDLRRVDAALQTAATGKRPDTGLV